MMESNSTNQDSKEKAFLPIPLNDLHNFSTLDAAKLYTLQILEWYEKRADLEFQLDSNADAVLKEQQEFHSWLHNFDYKRFKSPIEAYKGKLNLANQFIPFIKADLYRILKKNKKNKAKYSSTMMINKVGESDSFEADGFLFDDLDEALEEQGKESEVQCKDCKSTDCEEIGKEINQSTCVHSLNKFFTLISSENYIAQGSSPIIILGSGFGSLVYGAFLFSESRTIISCEWDSDLCKTQEEIVKKYEMGVRVAIERSSYPSDPDVLKESKLLVIISERISQLSQKEQIHFWTILKEHLQKESKIVTTKEMQVYFKGDCLSHIILNDWIRPEIQHGLTSSIGEDDDNEFKLNYYLYRVI